MASEKQRVELFIVLEYLLNFTSAEKPLIQAELIAYAEKEYGVIIRRDIIPDICRHLEELTSTYPDKFPFDVIGFNLGTEYRYYAVKTMLEEEDVKDIIYGINKNPFLSQPRAISLSERLKALALTPAQRGHALSNVHYHAFPHQPESLINRVNNLRDAKDNRALINFTVRKDYIIDDYTFIHDKIYYGYVYELMQFNNEPYAVIFVTGDIQKLVVFSIVQLRLKGMPIIMGETAPNINELYREAYNGRDITETLVENTVPFSEGSTQDISFTFANDNNNLQVVKTSFDFTFKRAMEYTSENNMVTVRFRANSYAFLSWATSLVVASIITVTDNDVVLAEIKAYYEKQLAKHSA